MAPAVHVLFGEVPLKASTNRTLQNDVELENTDDGTTIDASKCKGNERLRQYRHFSGNTRRKSLALAPLGTTIYKNNKIIAKRRTAYLPLIKMLI